MGICGSLRKKLNRTSKGSISMKVEYDNNTRNKKKEKPIKEEAMFPGHVEPLPLSKINIIIEQMKKSICKIDKENLKGTGFLCLIPYPNRLSLLPVLITCNHVLNDLKIETKTKLIFNGKEKIIIIDKFRKTYTNK